MEAGLDRHPPPAVRGRRDARCLTLAGLEAGPRRASALLRQALDEVAAGTRSAPEAELRALLSRSRILPKALWNPRLSGGLPTPDAYFGEAALALEVDSKAHHTSPADWERTMRRHNALGAHGVLVLHFSPARIRDDPVGVLAEIEHTYLDRVRVGGVVAPVTRTRSRRKH